MQNHINIYINLSADRFKSICGNFEVDCFSVLLEHGHQHGFEGETPFQPL